MMRPLAAPRPVVHPELGIESMESYLRRLASVYHCSSHQMLRYLCESSEVSKLVGQRPYRAPPTSAVLSGYSTGVRSLVDRLRAATDIENPAAMTLLRLGPALAGYSQGVLSSCKRLCAKCMETMVMGEKAPECRPILWSLATISFCPVHKVPLVIDPGSLRASSMLEIAAMRQGSLRWNSYAQWRLDETFALLSFCSDVAANDVVVDAPKVFLNEYMARRHLTLADMAQLSGAHYGNLKRQLEGTLRVTLATVFAIGQRLAISPLGILTDPRGAARTTSLFDIHDHAKDVEGSIPKGSHRHHPHQVLKQLRGRMVALLAMQAPLPALRSVCHEMNVSTGYARHHLSAETTEYLHRRLREAMKVRMARRDAARTEAKQVVGKFGKGLPIKHIEIELRKRTRLPKYLLLDELARASHRSRKPLSRRS